MQAQALSDQVATISGNLPYLRRYARALTGSQSIGDSFAAATLEAILEDIDVLTSDLDAKVGLFRAFHLVWSSAGAPTGEPDTRFSAVAQAHMVNLTPDTREVLLMHVIEGFTLSEIARILQTGEDHVASLLDTAVREMQASVCGRVMIIEDEAIISMDIAAIVQEMGHEVVGIAATRSEAVDLAAQRCPDLILADIQLADRSSGIDAVNDILKLGDEVPVIFITAFPERLLTGARLEPAFLITKPYAEEQIRSAVSQAMFFASTETLRA
jgi:CheY-like chemotaxis protein